jgi:hypothetical protein
MSHSKPAPRGRPLARTVCELLLILICLALLGAAG